MQNYIKILSIGTCIVLAKDVNASVFDSPPIDPVITFREYDEQWQKAVRLTKTVIIKALSDELHIKLDSLSKEDTERRLGLTRTYDGLFKCILAKNIIKIDDKEFNFTQIVEQTLITGQFLFRKVEVGQKIIQTMRDKKVTPDLQGSELVFVCD